jgi:hypothetical protein
LGYKGLYTMSVCVKGESMKEVKDLGTRIQEGQDQGSQRMQGASSASKEFELKGVRG